MLVSQKAYLAKTVSHNWQIGEQTNYLRIVMTNLSFVMSFKFHPCFLISVIKTKVSNTGFYMENKFYYYTCKAGTYGRIREHTRGKHMN